MYISTTLTGVASAVCTNKNWFFLDCTFVELDSLCKNSSYIRTVFLS